MDVYLGQTGLNKSWQANFPAETECVCGAKARIAFVCFEDGFNPDAEERTQYVCDLHKNKLADGGVFWPHDAVAVAVYFCEKGCAKGVTAEYNQA